MVTFVHCTITTISVLSLLTYSDDNKVIAKDGSG